MSIIRLAGVGITGISIIGDYGLVFSQYRFLLILTLIHLSRIYSIDQDL